MKRTNQALAIIGGIGAGAALMYFMDPERGRRRRELVKDKAVGITNDVKQTLESQSTHLRNKATGLMHDAKELVGINGPGKADTKPNNVSKPGIAGFNT